MGGDKIFKRDVEGYKKVFSQESILVVGLGTTETTRLAECFIDKETEIVGSDVPVGYAVADMDIRLLDDTGKTVGFNQIGEIAVKSRYLSQGYWQRPDLTRAAFIPAPGNGNERVYLTGDLGRMQPDGCLFHLGRKDFQVKIRGYRVQLGEVEMALLDLENIRGAVVVEGKDSLGEKRLIAYIVCDSRLTVSISSLRSSLFQRLPDYMIPEIFVFLDEMPRTPNGKVDRKALPEPDNSRPKLENAYIPAQTPVEQTLSEIWSDVLNINPVGINDKFLELGGNSLMAMQVITRVLRAFKIKLSPKSLFEAPTVAEMATVVVQNLSKRVEPEKLDQLLADLETFSDSEAKDFTKLK